MDSQQIATWAERKADKPADSPAYRRMTDSERRLILELHDKGLPQTEIAQRLGRAQSSICEVIHAFTDTTDLASRFLRGQARTMAENIVLNGRASDHIKALEGINVLAPTVSAGLVVQIGIKDSDVQVSLAAPTDALSLVPRNELTDKPTG